MLGTGKETGTSVPKRNEKAVDVSGATSSDVSSQQAKAHIDGRRGTDLDFLIRNFPIRLHVVTLQRHLHPGPSDN